MIELSTIIENFETMVGGFEIQNLSVRKDFSIFQRKSLRDYKCWDCWSEEFQNNRILGN